MASIWPKLQVSICLPAVAIQPPAAAAVPSSSVKRRPNFYGTVCHPARSAERPELLLPLPLSKLVASMAYVPHALLIHYGPCPAGSPAPWMCQAWWTSSVEMALSFKTCTCRMAQTGEHKLRQTAPRWLPAAGSLPGCHSTPEVQGHGVTSCLHPVCVSEHSDRLLLLCRYLSRATAPQQHRGRETLLLPLLHSGHLTPAPALLQANTLMSQLNRSTSNSFSCIAYRKVTAAPWLVSDTRPCALL